MATIFERALRSFKAHLTPVEQNSFTGTTLEDVRLTIASIQKTQITERTNKNVARLRKFLEAIESYSKVLDVFVNINDFVAFVWGPIKYLLLVSLPRMSRSGCTSYARLRVRSTQWQVILRQHDWIIMCSQQHLCGKCCQEQYLASVLMSRRKATDER